MRWAQRSSTPLQRPAVARIRAPARRGGGIGRRVSGGVLDEVPWGEPVQLIASTEDPSGEGDALLDLAVALLAAGDPSGARAAAAEAEGRYASKGNIAGVGGACTVARAPAPAA